MQTLIHDLRYGVPMLLKLPGFTLINVLALLLGLTCGVTAQSNEWPQWGGPQRNFTVVTKGLANAWPENGPRQLWKRDLGEGYAAIVAAGGTLYTLYRRGEAEVVIALDAQTGKTVWEYSYAAPFLPGMELENGPGPHATPLIVGDYLYTVGVTAKLHCLDRRNGKSVWRRDLWGEFKGTFIDTGYSASPIAYQNKIIVTVGGTGQALMAFNQKDGSVAWKRLDFANSPSSPTLINVGGQDQLVAFLARQIVGADPRNGELLWSHPHVTDWDLNISLPVWGADNLLFFSSAYGVGSRVLQLTRTGNQTTVKELWHNRRVRVHKDQAIRVGDFVYASSGDFGPAPFTAVNLKTGEIAWQDRSFAKATLLYADDKFILLDEDGNLGLAMVSPQGLKVLAKVPLLSQKAWTVPTLVGTKLYLRDRKIMLALELGN
jgi:outer membrane protein assembly factor BamB